jgi:hypothetical protein
MERETVRGTGGKLLHRAKPSRVLLFEVAVSFENGFPETQANRVPPASQADVGAVKLSNRCHRNRLDL